MPFERLTDVAGNYLTTIGGDYLGTANLDGCELTDDWRLLIELFYNPDEGNRRYGVDNYGDGFYGDSEAGPSTERWVDVTANCRYVSVARGNINPEVGQNTDDLTVEFVDTEGWLYAWQGPLALSSPQFNTPLRISMIDPRDGSQNVVSTGRLDDIRETFTPVSKYERVIEMHAYGQKTQLITSVFRKQYSMQWVADRITEVLADIDYVDAVDPYPAEFATVRLRADTDERIQDDAVAYSIIAQAAASAGYGVGTTAAGAITWRKIADAAPADFDVAECDDTGISAVYISANYRAGLDRILNVVQLQNIVDPAAGAEATDAISVSKWGRRSNGFGMPLITANDVQADAQAVADAILANTANVINRVADITFDTRSDPRWYNIFATLDVATFIGVQRTHPNSSYFTGGLIGLEFEAFPFTGIAATLHLSTSDTTVIA